MNHREIDRLVAEKVMRWNIIEYRDIRGTVIDDGEFPVDIEEFQPSKRIEDAWKIVEKLKEQRYLFSVSNIFSGDQVKYLAQFNNGNNERWIKGLAESETIAICKAALKTVGLRPNKT